MGLDPVEGFEGFKSVLIAKGREGIIRPISCFLAERKDCLLCRHVNTVQTGKGGSGLSPAQLVVLWR